MKRTLVILALLVSMIALVIAGSAPVLATFDSLMLPNGGEVPTTTFDGAGISAIVALILSLTLAYIPGFNLWWETFVYKRESLAAFGLLIALAMVGLHYAGAIVLTDVPLTFGWPVVWKVIAAWLAFAGAGQLTYTGVRKINGG